MRLAVGPRNRSRHLARDTPWLAPHRRYALRHAGVLLLEAQYDWRDETRDRPLLFQKWTRNANRESGSRSYHTGFRGVRSAEQRGAGDAGGHW
jgi:hypothetical protein